MKSVSVIASALAVCVSLSSMAVAQTSTGSLVVNTPMALTTCQNTSITWDNAAPGNVFLSVGPEGDAAATPLVQFNATDSSAKSLPWLVDLAEGTRVTIFITDSAGHSTGTAPVAIKKGLDTSCVGKGQSAHPGTSSAPAASSGSGSTGSSAGSSGSSSTPTSGSSSNSGTTPATSPSTKNPTTPSTPSTTANTSANNNTTSTSSTASKPSTVVPTTTTDNKAATDAAMGLQCQGLIAVFALAISTLFLMA